MNYSGNNYNFYCNESDSLSPGQSDTYDFIMSTIVLQHICSYDIRKSILTDMYRCLKENGILSIQMGFGSGHTNTADYYENAYHASSTNSAHDVRVMDKQYLIDDLSKIGFKNVETTIKNSWSDMHSQWIFVKATK
jgi:predicted SAM-dependent methyltransferase